MTLLRRLFSGLTDLAIAGAFFRVAALPGGWETPMGEILWRMALMEFWAIHAAGFLLWPWIAGDWGPRRRLLFVLAVGGGYSLVLGIASLVAGAWWPLAVFWAMTLNRAMDPVLRGRLSDEELFGVTEAWAGSIVFFMGAAIAVGLVGEERPVVLALAGVYYVGIGISELGGWWWVGRFLGPRSPRRSWRARWNERRRRRAWKKHGRGS